MKFTKLELILFILLTFVLVYGVFYIQRPEIKVAAEYKDSGQPIMMLLHLDEIPQATKDKVRATIRERLPELRQSFRELKQANREYQLAIATRADYDVEQAFAAAEKAAQAQQRKWQLTYEMGAIVMDLLTLEERQMFIEKRKEQLKMGAKPFGIN
ncbi:periplasmic heavy metal sensor [Alteromonas sp. ASW11-36]|uniref:Signaling pathway modulator ZraP n=1 Tax=Alteromonas arenosi TaxID=3055817 RepID=A0ABT7SWK7_9ALTE|nr:periplasmic heavy metal sensor [Alteromonas sp. ASW11-36]MDM7860551.1 periplasmic heavy metal sensor [Alteromonas sp. ASW11-36]